MTLNDLYLNGLVTMLPIMTFLASVFYANNIIFMTSVKLLTNRNTVIVTVTLLKFISVKYENRKEDR